MRFVASTALAALTVVSASQAALIDSNLPMTNASGQATGYAADAISSGGSYFYSQALAQTFTASQGYNLTQLTFWGSSENFVQPGLANFAGFQAVIYSADFSTVIATKTWTLAQLQVTATGALNPQGGIEYQFAGNLTGGLAAGTYRLSVGAILVNGQDDAFIWSNGEANSGLYYSIGANFGTNWSANDTGSGSFLLFGNVPSPGALALLGLAGLTGRRRR